jgi:hypothetical protein
MQTPESELPSLKSFNPAVRICILGQCSFIRLYSRRPDEASESRACKASLLEPETLSLAREIS